MKRTVWAAVILTSLATGASAGQVPPGGGISGVPKGVHATGDLADQVRAQAAARPATVRSAAQYSAPRMATGPTTALQDNRPLLIYRRIGRERPYNR